MPPLRADLLNAWVLSLPLILVGIVLQRVRPDVAKRFSDMTDYSTGERIVTVAASLSPYLFMVATIWTPFVRGWALPVGIALYSSALILLCTTVRVALHTPVECMFSDGPYRFSRNPLYLAASLVFLAICMMTRRSELLVYWIGMIMLHHFMIRAEERSCLRRYGEEFRAYLRRVPRYLII